MNNVTPVNILRLVGVLCILFGLVVQVGWVASSVAPILALIIGVIFLLVSGVL